MPTKDKVKNQEYVAKHRTNLRASIGDEAYKKQEAEARKLRRHKVKANSQQEQTKRKMTATKMGNDMVNNLFNNIKVIELKPKKRGRPIKEDPIDTTNLPYKERRKIYMRLYMRELNQRKRQLR
jgi:hypothetical protein